MKLQNIMDGVNNSTIFESSSDEFQCFSMQASQLVATCYCKKYIKVYISSVILNVLMIVLKVVIMIPEHYSSLVFAVPYI